MLPIAGLTTIVPPVVEELVSWPQAMATAVSADGSTIVGAYQPADQSNSADFRPFVWTRERGLQDLEVLLASLGVETNGWWLQEATGVSADGRTLIGNGRILSELGHPHAFVWIAVIPEPSTALLVGAGLILLGHTRRGTRRPVSQ